MKRRFSSLIPKVIAAGAQTSRALWALIFGTFAGVVGAVAIYKRSVVAQDAGTYSLKYVVDIKDPEAFAEFVNNNIKAFDKPTNWSDSSQLKPVEKFVVEISPQPQLNYSISHQVLDQALQETVSLARSNPELGPAQISKFMFETLIKPS